MKAVVVILRPVYIGLLFFLSISTPSVAMSVVVMNDGVGKNDRMLKALSFDCFNSGCNALINLIIRNAELTVRDFNSHFFDENTDHFVVDKLIALSSLIGSGAVNDEQVRKDLNNSHVNSDHNDQGYGLRKNVGIVLPTPSIKKEIDHLKAEEGRVKFSKSDVDKTNSLYGFSIIDTVSIQELMDLALSYSPRLAQTKEQMKINEALIDEAKSAWLPRLSINGNAGKNSGSVSKEYGVSINQLLYDFGQTNYNIDAATHNYISSSYQQIAESISILQQTAAYYVEIKRYEGLVVTVEDGISDLEKIHDMALQRSNAGLATKSDALQIQSRISGMRTALSQYKAILDEFKMKITVLTGVSAKNYKPFYINAGSLDPNQIELSKIPIVLMAEANIATANVNLKKIERSSMPVLSLSAGKKMKYDDDSRWEDQINLNLNYPLYQGGELSARVKQATGSLYIARKDLEQIKLNIMQSIQISLNNWVSSEKQKDESLGQYKNAKEAKDVYKDEYLLGKRSLSDLLSVEQDLIQSIESRINADSDGWLAIVDYFSATGQLFKKVKDTQYN